MATIRVPAIKVEIAFDSTPLDDTPTWTDVSAYVLDQSASITRGRNDEQTGFSPGSLRLVLNNRDRRFDPSHASGPYFGNLLPRKQIRVSGVWSATTYGQFYGHVVGWPQTYSEHNRHAVVELEAVDALAVFAETTMPDSQIAEIDDTDRVMYLYNSDGLRWLDLDGSYDATVNTTNGVPRDATAGTLTMSGGWTVSGSVWTHSVASAAINDLPVGANDNFDLTWSCWFQTTLSATDAPQSEVIYLSVSMPIVSVAQDTGAYGGLCHIVVSAPGGNGTVVVGTFNDGRPHHVVVVFQPVANATTVYVDGEWAGAGTYGATAFAYTFATTNAGSAPIPGGVYRPSEVSGFGIWLRAFTAAEVSELYDATSGSIPESSSARAGRLLDLIGWPASWRALTTSSAGVCDAYDPNGKTTLGELQLVEATEQGRLFVDRAGLVTLHDRYHHLTQTRGTTVQATFSDDGSDIRYVGFGTDFDDLHVVNDLTVSGSRSTSHNEQDATSITNYGWQSGSISTLLGSSAECESMATAVLLHRKDAYTRTRPIVIKGASQTSQWATLLGLEIGDRIKVEITPMRNVGSQIVLTCLIERIQWDMSADDWVLTLTASPVPGAAAAATSFLVLGDATFGVIGTGLVGY